MKQKGKHGKKWDKVRAAFIAANPANHQGYYKCSLCPRWIHESEITIDHIIPRSRAPALRYVFSNLAFAHSECNAAKGSKVAVKRPEDLNEVPDELEGLW